MKDLLKDSLVGAAAVSLPGVLPKTDAWAAAVSDAQSPMETLASVPGKAEFAGDNFSKPHRILWQKEQYIASKGGIPAPQENVNVVVIGGGMAGLSAAYELRDLKPILLEQAPRFGGNSKGERWGDLSYSIGAAYFNYPEKGSTPHRLLTELGLINQVRRESSEHVQTLLGGQLIQSFWQGATDPSRAEEFQKVAKKLKSFYTDSYPEIPAPVGDAKARDRLNQLDRQSFKDWVVSNLGQVHPHIEEYFQEYCWSSYGGGWDELSAAQVLNFVSADSHGIAALPGGNGTITEALYQRLKRELPRGSLRAQSCVLDIAPTPKGVQVCYEGADGKIRSILAKACIVCSPKFVAAKLIPSMGSKQKDAIAKIRYRAYLVANVLLKKKYASSSYDLFRIQGKPPTDRARDSVERPFTDLIFGGWAAHDRTKRSTLTLYKPLPFDGSRGLVFADAAFAMEKARFEAALPEVLGALKIPSNEVAGVRVARWGHPMPVAATGLIADGTLEQASAPIDGRIFFAHQDNWTNPCFEGSVKAGFDAATQVRRVVTRT